MAHPHRPSHGDGALGEVKGITQAKSPDDRALQSVEEEPSDECVESVEMEDCARHKALKEG